MSGQQLELSPEVLIRVNGFPPMWELVGMKVQKYSNHIFWEGLLYGDMSSPMAMGKLENKGVERV